MLEPQGQGAEEGIESSQAKAQQRPTIRAGFWRSGNKCSPDPGPSYSGSDYQGTPGNHFLGTHIYNQVPYT